MCEGVVLLKSGNKETLYLVKPSKTSWNRGLFYANSLLYWNFYAFEVSTINTKNVGLANISYSIMLSLTSIVSVVNEV